MNNLLKNAIDAALSQNWEKAVEYNTGILAINEKNIDALNRLAFAYSQMGNCEKSKKIYKKVLSLDKYNYIAHKNLDKLGKGIKKNRSASQIQSKPCFFIEEPGKTKTVMLVNTAPISAINDVNIGHQVTMSPKKYTVEIRTLNKKYIGALPDDLSFRLIKLINSGNEYEVHIRNIQKKSVTVFMRETKRGKKYSNILSFQTTYSSMSISKDRSGKSDENEDIQESEE